MVEFPKVNMLAAPPVISGNDRQGQTATLLERVKLRSLSDQWCVIQCHVYGHEHRSSHRSSDSECLARIPRPVGDGERHASQVFGMSRPGCAGGLHGQDLMNGCALL